MKLSLLHHASIVLASRGELRSGRNPRFFLSRASLLQQHIENFFLFKPIMRGRTSEQDMVMASSKYLSLVRKCSYT